MSVLQALLAQGSCTEAQEEDNWTAVMLASKEGHSGVVKVSSSFQMHNKSYLFEK